MKTPPLFKVKSLGHNAYEVKNMRDGKTLYVTVESDGKSAAKIRAEAIAIATAVPLYCWG